MKIVTFMRPTSIVCGVGESSISDDEKFFEFFFHIIMKWWREWEEEISNLYDE